MSAENVNRTTILLNSILNANAAEEEEKCLICHQTENLDKICSCSMLVHKECINRWLNEGNAGNTNCPLCQAALNVKIVTEYQIPKRLRTIAMMSLYLVIMYYINTGIGQKDYQWTIWTFFPLIIANQAILGYIWLLFMGISSNMIFPMRSLIGGAVAAIITELDKIIVQVVDSAWYGIMRAMSAQLVGVFVYYLWYKKLCYSILTFGIGAILIDPIIMYHDKERSAIRGLFVYLTTLVTLLYTGLRLQIIKTTVTV